MRCTSILLHACSHANSYLSLNHALIQFINEQLLPGFGATKIKNVSLFQEVPIFSDKRENMYVQICIYTHTYNIRTLLKENLHKQ